MCIRDSFYSIFEQIPPRYDVLLSKQFYKPWEVEMLNPGKLYDNIVKNSRIRIDIMNKNAITSLAMIYALWQSKRQDLLDLIRPFVLYAVGSTTTLNSEIDIL